MDYTEFKKIVKDMEESNLSELSIEFPDGTKIGLKKESHVRTNIPSNIVSHAKDIQDISKKIEIEEDKENFKIMKSPMVGTFYEKPSPDAEKFVTVGQRVKKGDVLCIIEAMKLMNEIESEFDGEIIEIFVKEGDAVDYNKPLFKIGEIKC